MATKGIPALIEEPSNVMTFRKLCVRAALRPSTRITITALLEDLDVEQRGELDLQLRGLKKTYRGSVGDEGIFESLRDVLREYEEYLEYGRVADFTKKRLIELVDGMYNHNQKYLRRRTLVSAQ